ncbi:MAG: phosphoglycerate kinase [Candidatus Nanopelagicales bacterium]|nr:phosphoglycerate kinase [Candidatus Nanopelagicales bacterium]MCF8536592.1 phosphoglycerate kinase [Candidatus Nanopelagicales bacterium]MCF8541625.1 phosphoglycerate kinase [Candidatus Nanopelagicales bacterium]MCF8556259.1 phosphoglycerate kinase [Candidatus Nanopelagicales bacterium]
MKSLDDLDVAGRTVLVRADFNVPLADGPDGSRVITDDGRIVAALPTLEYLRSKGARVIVAAHLGRAKGVRVPELSLAPVAARLGDLLGTTVTLADLADAPPLVAGMAPGDVLLLENIRFDGRETSKDADERAELAKELAALADVYVSDGFGVVHRNQASVTDVARLLPSAAGRLVHQEASVFGGIMAEPARPFVVILGGSKVSDKLGVIGNLIGRVDRLLIGGGMAYTFLKAQGLGVGESLLEADQVETVRGFIDEAATRGVELLLPVDFVVADRFAADAQTEIVAADAIPDGWMGLDIGPRTRELFASKIADAGTVVWNGPMGVFEMEPFAGGTLAVAQAMAGSSGFTVIGGGDSAAAVRQLDVDETRFTHISTGGGASLEFLEGKTLPGLAVLEETT